MQDRELYRQLLGLVEPWEVTEIGVDFEAHKVDVRINWPDTKPAPCPECSKEYAIYDHRDERQWRHLDTMQFQTIIHCRVPRIMCPEHGVKSVDISWAEKHSRFTALFERLAIDVLLACSNQTKAMELLGLSWDEVHNIQEKAVGRGLGRRAEGELKYIGVDEKSFLSGHQYATVVCDLSGSRVIDVARDRKGESLAGILKNMPENQRASIRAVAMDMWEPYRNVTQSLLPGADIVHDKFHLVKYLCEAVDKVRRAENKELFRNGASCLKGTKYLWLTRPARWTKEQKGMFNDLKGRELKVGRAWSMKEMLLGLWDYTYEKAARTFFSNWYYWVTHSKLRPLIDVAKMLKRHLDNILTYLKHRITNALSEGLNSKIQLIKSAARGFRNFEHFRIAILFYCGRLDMYPHKSQ